MLPDLHTDFSRGRLGGLVFQSLSEYSTFIVIHTVKGFGIVNKVEIDVFLGWRKHKLESRLLGEISITSNMQMMESEEELKNLLIKVKEESEKLA